MGNQDIERLVIEIARVIARERVALKNIHPDKRVDFLVDAIANWCDDVYGIDRHTFKNSSINLKSQF